MQIAHDSEDAGQCDFAQCTQLIDLKYKEEGKEIVLQEEVVGILKAQGIDNSIISVIICYLGRLNAQLNRIEQEHGQKAAEFNFVQIACGTLSGEGAPLAASLSDSLGATRPSRSVSTMFICGGTLFLDESQMPQWLSRIIC